MAQTTIDVAKVTCEQLVLLQVADPDHLVRSKHDRAHPRLDRGRRDPDLRWDLAPLSGHAPPDGRDGERRVSRRSLALRAAGLSHGRRGPSRPHHEDRKGGAVTSVGVLAHSAKTLGGGLEELRKTLATYEINDPMW